MNETMPTTLKIELERYTPPPIFSRFTPLQVRLGTSRRNPGGVHIVVYLSSVVLYAHVYILSSYICNVSHALCYFHTVRMSVFIFDREFALLISA